MKILSLIAVTIILITLFASCKTGKDVNKILLKSATRQEIMNTIANSVNMSKEMMNAMLLSKNDHAMILENKEMVLKMRRDYPGMIQRKSMKIPEKYKNDEELANNINISMMVN